MILALDPSLTAFGYAVIKEESQEVAAYGCIKTDKGSDVDRLIIIYDELAAVIKEHSPTKAYVEDTCGSQSARAATALGMIKGLVIGVLKTNGIPFQHVEARNVKWLLTGNYNAEKIDIINKVDEYYSIKEIKLAKYFKEAIADAMAVYLYFRLIKEEVKHNNGQDNNTRTVRTGRKRGPQKRRGQGSRRRSGHTGAGGKTSTPRTSTRKV